MLFIGGVKMKAALIKLLRYTTIAIAITLVFI